MEKVLPWEVKMTPCSSQPRGVPAERCFSCGCPHWHVHPPSWRRLCSSLPSRAQRAGPMCSWGPAAPRVTGSCSIFLYAELICRSRLVAPGTEAGLGAALPSQAPSHLQAVLQLPSFPSFLLAGRKMGIHSGIEKGCKKNFYGRFLVCEKQTVWCNKQLNETNRRIP